MPKRFKTEFYLYHAILLKNRTSFLAREYKEIYFALDIYHFLQNNLRIAAGFSIVFGKYKYSSKVNFLATKMCSKKEMRQRNGN